MSSHNSRPLPTLKSSSLAPMSTEGGFLRVTGALSIFEIGSLDGGVPLALHVNQVNMRAAPRAWRRILEMKKQYDVINTNKTTDCFQRKRVNGEGRNVEIHSRPKPPSAEFVDPSISAKCRCEHFHQHNTNVPPHSRTSVRSWQIQEEYLLAKRSCSRGWYVQDSCIDVDPGQRVRPGAREAFVRPKRCDGRTVMGNPRVRHTGVAQVHITRIFHL